MQIKTFVIPISSENGEVEDFNRFLRSVRILEVKKELVNTDCSVFWAFCVTFMENQPSSTPFASQNGKVKMDYKDILNEEDFAKFCRLRKIRKQLADDSAIPAFAVFSDAELAEMSKIEKLTIQALKNIKGIGDKKIEKYGAEICRLADSDEVKKDEEGRESV